MPFPEPGTAAATVAAALFSRSSVLPPFSTRVGVGQSRYPTPRGEYYVREKLQGYYAPAYGPRAFGLNARSAKLTNWPGGGFIGIHGTNQPGLIPGRISHGCVRVNNAAVLRLFRLMPPMGRKIAVRQRAVKRMAVDPADLEAQAIIRMFRLPAREWSFSVP